jgi:hypothetical protein
MPDATTISLDRVVSAVEKVRQRLLRVCSALDQADVRYAVVGGNAVAAWVSTVDEAAIRNTRNVDVTINRKEFESTRTALQAAGFHYRHVAGLDIFLETPDGSVRDAVHLVFAGELVRGGEPCPHPSLELAKDTGQFKVLDLPSLVQIKLTAFRDKDRTHLRDLIEVGLVDESWIANLPNSLGDRLMQLLADPNG